MANTLVDLIKAGDREALNAYLVNQQIGGDSSGVSLNGQPNNALASVLRRPIQPPMQQSMQDDGMQPLNTIRTSSGEYLTPSGERSATPVGFGANPSPEFRGRPVDVFGQGKGYMQPDGTIVGVNSQGQRFSVNPAGTEAARQAGIDQGLKRQMMQAQLASMTAKGDTSQKWDTVQTDEGFAQVNPVTGEVRKLGISPIGKQGPVTPQQRVQDATDAINILQQAAPLINKATASGAGTAVDYLAGLGGMSTAGAEAADQLKVLGGALVSKMPKMSGPQSDKDVQLYKEMAGRIGDPMIPAARKKAAMQTIMELQAKYAGTEPLPLNFDGQTQVPAQAYDADKEARYQAWKAQQGR